MVLNREEKALLNVSGSDPLQTCQTLHAWVRRGWKRGSSVALLPLEVSALQTLQRMPDSLGGGVTAQEQ